MAVAFGGCLGDAGGETPDGRTTESATGTDSPTSESPTDVPGTPPETMAFGERFTVDDGWSVGLYEARVRRMVATDDGVRVPDGVQFLVATVVVSRGESAGDRDVETNTPSPVPDPGGLDLAIEVDGQSNPAGSPTLVARQPFDDGLVRVAFPVPTDQSSGSISVVLTHSGRRAVWAVPEPVVALFDDVPRFTVATFEGPDAVAADAENVEVRLRVENVGDRDGVFTARLDSDGRYQELFDLPVARGGSSNWSQHVPVTPRDPHELVLEVGDREHTHEIELQGSSE
jgi:hypothetical protein